MQAIALNDLHSTLIKYKVKKNTLLKGDKKNLHSTLIKYKDQFQKL